MPDARLIADHPLLERLAQRLEHADRELGQLVEEQHAAMRERDLAGADAAAAAADERDGSTRCGAARGTAASVRSAETAVRPGGRVDARDFERVVAVERRQDRRQPAGEHRLADARRADQQQVVTAGRRDRERATRVGEAAHVGEVEGLVGVAASSATRSRIGRIGPRRFALQARVQLAERCARSRT